MTQAPGRLIVVEGVDGAGKTSLIEHFKECLESYGITVQRTREPGGTPMAESIRSVMLDPRDERVDALTELLLVWASRRQLITNFILPQLQAGTWILCDRFVYTTIAYQIAGRGLPMALNDTLKQEVLTVDGEFIWPDFQVFVDVPFAVAQQRLMGRTEKQDRMDLEFDDFKRRVETSLRSHDYDITLDGSLPFAENKALFQQAIQPLLPTGDQHDD